MSNLSQLKREVLEGFLDRLMTKIGDSEEDRILLAEVKKEIDAKRYGLIWEEHSERVDEQLEKNIPVFFEDRQRKITVSDNEPYNFLLEGDNLHSLYLLEKTHLGKIDVILIDPPYNTGNNDFIYDDNFVNKEDSYSHSKWLSFMYNRLKHAKNLLSVNGVILINIDDNEQAQLKLLCDQIFGEDNFITSIPWHNRTSIQNDTDISINHEYIIAYAKFKRKNNRRFKDSLKDVWQTLEGFTFNTKQVDLTKFSNPDNDPRGAWKADPLDAPQVRPNLTYAIVNPNTGKIFYPPKGRHWRFTEEKYKQALADNRIVFGKKGLTKPQLKVFLNEVKEKGSVIDTWFDSDVYGTSTEGTKELLSLLPESDKIFSTPKPSRLYTRLLEVSMGTKKHGTVLDFFAGSGTTGQAVMQLNKEDGGNRKYILCTNNENNICEEITYRRLKNIQSEFPHNLKYFKTDFIGRDEPELYDLLQENVTCLIELENACEASGDQLEIIFTDEQLDNFLKSGKRNNCRLLYVSSMILLPDEVRQELEAASVKIMEIPEYYFGTELYEQGF